MNIKKILALSLVVAVVASACEKDRNTKRSGDNNPIDSTFTASSLFVSSADTLLPGIGVVKNLVDFDTVTVYNNNNVDGNGIAVDTARNIVYQLGRKNSTLYVYNNASMLKAGTPNRVLTVTGLVSGRELAYDGQRDVLYISSNTDSTIIALSNPSSLSGAVNPSRKLKLNGEPWGIAIDVAGDRLFVAKDKTAMYQIYTAISTKDSTVAPNTQTSITGANRVHGITYNAANGNIVVTDINNVASATDGSIYVINPALAIGLLNIVTPTATISGAATQLGNPVDVAFGNGSIYVAEKTNGGKILRFAATATGNVAPTSVISYPALPEAICLDIR